MSPEDAILLCEIEERAARLVDRITQVKNLIEFEALAAAADIGHVDRAMNFTKQLDAVTAEYEAFNTQLRWLIARLRLQAGPA